MNATRPLVLIPYWREDPSFHRVPYDKSLTIFVPYSRKYVRLVRPRSELSNPQRGSYKHAYVCDLELVVRGPKPLTDRRS